MQNQKENKEAQDENSSRSRGNQPPGLSGVKKNPQPKKKNGKSGQESQPSPFGETPKKDKKPRFNYYWLYLLLLLGIVFTMLYNRGGPEMTDWNHVETMVRGSQ